MSEAERYDVTQYERPSVTVDVVIFSVVEGELKVLLIRRRNWLFEGMWAINNDNLWRHSAAHRFSIWARPWMPNCGTTVPPAPQ